MSSFDSVAAFYEVLSDSPARLEREGPLLAEWARQAPGNRVWDIACGTGIHAEFFAGLGAEVTALDASTQMIRHARERRPHQRINYQVADMRDLPQARADLVVCLGNSLSILDNVQQAQSVTAAVAGRLEPGGLFCVQVVNYFAEGMDRARHRVETRQLRDGNVVAVKNIVPHKEKTLLSLSFFHETEGVYHTATDTAILLRLTLADFQTAAEKAKLTITGAFGGHDKRPFDPATSPDLIVVMKNGGGVG